MLQPAPIPDAPMSDANTLGLDYRAQAAALPYRGPILDVHTHLLDADAAQVFFAAAETYGVRKAWSMTPLSRVAEVAEVGGERVEFIAVPDHARAKVDCEAYTTGWLREMERFRELGSRVVKFWAAPRGRDFDASGEGALLLDSPFRRRSMRLAYDLGFRVFMTHVGDPDTWFATAYADAAKYGTKREQYPPLERGLDEYPDVTWIGAHLGGWPEDLDFLQGMLDRHPNYVLDCSATKWMVRELSKRPAEFRAFCGRNAGRVLFGSDVVATSSTIPGAEPATFDVVASRYWALRTLIETAYDGPSPIVDPDLHRLDPSLPVKSTPPLRGAALPADLLPTLYAGAAERVLASAS